MSLIRTLALGAAVTLAAPAAAQTATYRCTAKDGKKYYSSAIPSQCLGSPIDRPIGRRFDGGVMSRVSARRRSKG